MKSREDQKTSMAGRKGADLVRKYEASDSAATERAVEGLLSRPRFIRDVLDGPGKRPARAILVAFALLSLVACNTVRTTVRAGADVTAAAFGDIETLLERDDGERRCR